jgi:hypothetical protein
MSGKMNWDKARQDSNMERWGTEGPAKRLTKWEEQSFDRRARPPVTRRSLSRGQSAARYAAKDDARQRAKAVNEARRKNGLPPLKIRL